MGGSRTSIKERQTTYISNIFRRGLRKKIEITRRDFSGLFPGEQVVITFDDDEFHLPVEIVPETSFLYSAFLVDFFESEAD